MTPRLVLASRSPQRRRILEDLGVAFVVRATGVEEGTAGPAEAVARENAVSKALAAAPGAGEIVLGVDTVVALDGELWGKPADAEAARSTLARLAGQTHDVVSAIALTRGDVVETAVERTAVTFRALDAVAIDAYVARGEWEGRAGAYAIQGHGATLVRRIAGDYLNVVGLPVAALIELWPEVTERMR